MIVNETGQKIFGEGGERDTKDRKTKSRKSNGNNSKRQFSSFHFPLGKNKQPGKHIDNGHDRREKALLIVVFSSKVLNNKISKMLLASLTLSL